jgi:hypothetical protein
MLLSALVVSVAVGCGTDGAADMQARIGFCRDFHGSQKSFDSLLGEGSDNEVRAFLEARHDALDALVPQAPEPIAPAFALVAEASSRTLAALRTANWDPTAVDADPELKAIDDDEGYRDAFEKLDRYCSTTGPDAIDIDTLARFIAADANIMASSAGRDAGLDDVFSSVWPFQGSMVETTNDANGLAVRPLDPASGAEGVIDDARYLCLASARFVASTEPCVEPSDE